MSDVNARIEAEVKNNDVVLFMKGTPQSRCGFSGQVAQISAISACPIRA
jgi:monothiol glutaredoxin